MTKRPNRWDEEREKAGGWYGLTINAIAGLILFTMKAAILTFVVISIARWMGV